MNYEKLFNLIPKKKDANGNMVVPKGLITYMANNAKDVRWFKTFSENSTTVDGTLFIVLDLEDQLLLIINRLHPEDKVNDPAESVKQGFRKFAEGKYYVIDTGRKLLTEGQLDKFIDKIIQEDHPAKERMNSDFIGTVKSIYKMNPL